MSEASDHAGVAVTGELRDAYKYPCWGGLGFMLCGRLYGDVRGRFTDGSDIHTSYVTEALGDDVFRTKNSVYRVTAWVPDAKSQSL